VLIKRTAVNQQANINKGRTLREAKQMVKRAREEEVESPAPNVEAARPKKRAKGAHTT
jgi:hypothetical protein